MILGIDASNIRSGGGVTHLVELLYAVDPIEHGFSRVIIWSCKKTLDRLEDRPWLVKIQPDCLNKSLPRRIVWQRFILSQHAQKYGCDVLFVPGGSYAGSFRPYVTMSRNLLPFEWCELRRYGFTWSALKCFILRLTQSRSFKYADGVIFLTDYAQKSVLDVTGELSGQVGIIPHGLNPRFSIKPKEQKSIFEYTDVNPYRLVYVSIIEQYKHQWHVVAAVHKLRQEGIPVVLDLVGPAYPPALKRLNDALSKFDPTNQWVHYHGPIPYDDLHQIYQKADLGIFASSCENMPNILLETMATGLPIACSDRGPMPEMLGSAGLYLDPENPDDIANALRQYIDSPRLRADKSKESFALSQNYSWKCCADQTFLFLHEIAKNYNIKSNQ